MTKFTDEQIALIDAAIDEIHSQVGEGGRVSGSEIKERIIAELTTPGFTEGQMVFSEDPNLYGWCGYLWQKEGNPTGCRELKQSEVGPNWVPKSEYNEIVRRTIAIHAEDYESLLAEFEKLRDSITSITNDPEVITGFCYDAEVRRVLASLPDHLKGGE